MRKLIGFDSTAAQILQVVLGGGVGRQWGVSLLEHILPSMNRDQTPILDSFFSVPLGNVSQNVNNNSIVIVSVIIFLINKY